jgi:hypothetical protein
MHIQRLQNNRHGAARVETQTTCTATVPPPEPAVAVVHSKVVRRRNRAQVHNEIVKML